MAETAIQRNLEQNPFYVLSLLDEFGRLREGANIPRNEDQTETEVEVVAEDRLHAREDTDAPVTRAPQKGSRTNSRRFRKMKC